MERLKELRKALGLTQAVLADHLNVSQQTVARWERGDAEPNFAMLRDIATLMGTSVDDLLEYSVGRAKIPSQHWNPQDENIDGFWGHIGLLLPGKAKSQWYPITESECGRVSRLLSERHSSSGWLLLSTLNNKILIVNPDLMQRIRFLDDAADQPDDGDWVLSLDSYQGWGAEIYRGIGEYFWDEEEFESKNSLAMKKIIGDLVEEHELDEKAAYELLEHTKVYLNNGSLISFKADRSDAYQLAIEADCATPSTIRLENAYSGELNYFAPMHVALVEAPLTEYLEAAREMMEELES
ncbi:MULTISPECIES: helix-turn-helix transcriptional regulator [unclassified Pseudomonas]|uniref:helix-turn-helix transcriptional regulator n=1 Tax=unclassified Pseudomonas TaxID=196821 RepID=UPI000A1E4616|nr:MULTISPECIES: helix-turn-helix transcriptional regulator [unclassified Pseudomonas]